MWLYTDIGFFSIVQKDGAGTLTIRSRVRKDLENFCHVMQQINGLDAEIIESCDSDYRYRIVVPQNMSSIIFMTLGQRITYDNFKDHIKMKDPRRADIYSGIWGRSLALEELDEEDE